jgi:hypothetical protein
MEKAETLSFPTVIGSGGRGQSLINEILVGAKSLRLCFVQLLRCEIQLHSVCEIETHNQFLPRSYDRGSQKHNPLLRNHDGTGGRQ